MGSMLKWRERCDGLVDDEGDDFGPVEFCLRGGCDGVEVVRYCCFHERCRMDGHDVDLVQFSSSTGSGNQEIPLCPLQY